MISFLKKQGIIAMIFLAFTVNATNITAMDSRNRPFVDALVDLFKRLVRTENGYDAMLLHVLSDDDLAEVNARARYKACGNIIVVLLDFGLPAVRRAFFKNGQALDPAYVQNCVRADAVRYCIEKPTELCNALKKQYKTADLKAAVRDYVWRDDFAACDRGCVTLDIYKAIDAFYGVRSDHERDRSSSQPVALPMEQDLPEQDFSQQGSTYDYNDDVLFNFDAAKDRGTPCSDGEDEDDTPVDDCSSTIDQSRRRATLPLACPAPRGGRRDSLYVTGADAE